MPVRPFGSGYDPNSGWPADDSTGVPWDSDVDLSGYGSFGPGGFAPNPKLTGPVTGSYGRSLSGPGGISDNLTARPATPADAAAMGGPAMTSGPQNLRPGMSPAVRNGPGPATDVFANAAPMPRWMSLFRGGPLGAAATVMNPTPTANDAAPTNKPFQRPSYFGPMGDLGPYRTGVDPRVGEGAGVGPMSPNPPGTIVPSPIGSPAPAVPPVRPRAAGPAAARQQPNLGAYDGTIARPNMDVIRGGRNNPGQQTQMGVADWSKLFQRPQQ